MAFLLFVFCKFKFLEMIFTEHNKAFLPKWHKDIFNPNHEAENDPRADVEHEPIPGVLLYDASQIGLEPWAHHACTRSVGKQEHRFLNIKGGHAISFISPEIHKFLGSFLNRRSANFWGM